MTKKQRIKEYLISGFGVPAVLELRALEKWDGVMPKVTGGAIPFINID